MQQMQLLNVIKYKKMNWTFKNQKFQSSKYLPPLFGIPISIKDAFDMQGFSTTAGVINRANTKFEQSPLIACFKNNGMIPYVRTNIPQMGMTFQSVNNIRGRSLNPWNRDRTVGGSSGGQGGLISSRCSILGIGSDIGGSIRIPAEFCGIVGLKPYSKRFSASYHTKFSDAFTGSAGGIPLCIGPLAKSAQDLAYFMKATTNENFYGNNSDPYIKNIQFDQKTYVAYSNQKDKLKIGFIKSLTDIQPTKASQRALKQVVDKLKGMGHDCVEIQIPNETQIIRQFLKQNLGTGVQLFREILAGQQPIKQYTSLFQIAQMSSPIKAVAKCASTQLMPRATMSSYQYQKHLGLIDNFKRQWIKYWKFNKLNFVICPGFGCQAVIHGNSQNTALAASYCFLWNVLDMCVGTIPITTVNPDQQVYETVHTDILADALRKNGQNCRGLPVGVQIVGLPYQEQKVLGLMNLLQKNILFYKSHPLPKVE